MASAVRRDLRFTLLPTLAAFSTLEKAAMAKKRKAPKKTKKPST